MVVIFNRASTTRRKLKQKFDVSELVLLILRVKYWRPKLCAKMGMALFKLLRSHYCCMPTSELDEMLRSHYCCIRMPTGELDEMLRNHYCCVPTGELDAPKSLLLYAHW